MRRITHSQGSAHFTVPLKIVCFFSFVAKQLLPKTFSQRGVSHWAMFINEIFMGEKIPRPFSR